MSREPEEGAARKSGRARGRTPFSRGRVALGAFLFVLLTAAGFAVVFLVANPGDVPLRGALAAARPGLLILAGLVALGELALGGSRVWLLARHLGPGFRWRDALQAHLYNVFASGLTPLQAGGGPAQYYILRRSGLPAPRAVAVLAGTWVGVMTGYALFGSLAAAYVLGGLEASGATTLVRGVFVTFLVAAVGGFLLVLFPHRLERLLLTRGWARRHPRRRRIVRGLGRYRRAVRGLAGAGRRAWMANAGCSWSMLGARCAIGLLVLAALGIEAEEVTAVALQTLQFALITVSPSPGGSGVAELSTLGFMVGLVPAALMAAYALLWRGLTAWVGIGVGAGLVIFDQARRLRARATRAPGGGAGGSSAPQAASAPVPSSTGPNRGTPDGGVSTGTWR